MLLGFKFWRFGVQLNKGVLKTILGVRHVLQVHNANAGNGVGVFAHSLLKGHPGINIFAVHKIPSSVSNTAGEANKVAYNLNYFVISVIIKNRAVPVFNTH